MINYPIRRTGCEPKPFYVLLIAGMLLSSHPLLAQTVQQPQPPAPQAEKAAAPARPQAQKAAAPEPDPRQVLQKMCDFLKSQQQFTYKAEVAARPGLPGRQKTSVWH